MKHMAQLYIEGLVLTYYMSQSFQQQIQATTVMLNGPEVKLSTLILEREAKKVLRTKRASKARKESETKNAFK